MKKELKKPTDYPQLNFRIDPIKKDKINTLLEKVMKNALRNWSEGERKPKRNDFLAESVELGLEEILKKQKAKK